jgi:hypothetical protein
MGTKTHPIHGVTKGCPDERAKDRGSPCGCPLTNEDTELRDKDAVRCVGCGDVVPVDAAMLARIRSADATMRCREDREDKGRHDRAEAGPQIQAATQCLVAVLGGIVVMFYDGAWNAEWRTPGPTHARHVRRRGFVQPTGADPRFNDEDQWGHHRPEWHWGAYIRHMRRMRNAASVLCMKR